MKKRPKIPTVLFDSNLILSFVQDLKKKHFQTRNMLAHHSCFIAANCKILNQIGNKPKTLT